VKPFSRLARRLFPSLATFLLRGYAATIRFRLEDPAGFLKSPPPGPVLFAFWHNRLLLMPMLNQFYFGQRHCVSLISRSRDGQMISEIVEKFGLQTIRGSSSQKALAALRALIRAVTKEQLDAAITPDGPRGPRYHVHPGILHLSQMTGAPILPISIDYSGKWELPSWDRFQIPYPFTRAVLKFHPYWQVPPGAQAETFPAAQARLTKELGDSA
jgi:lysophospholipid acyltransferase (LPLAT)-like uncharacterized protein